MVSAPAARDVQATRARALPNQYALGVPPTRGRW